MLESARAKVAEKAEIVKKTQMAEKTKIVEKFTKHGCSTRFALTNEKIVK